MRWTIHTQSAPCIGLWYTHLKHKAISKNSMARGNKDKNQNNNGYDEEAAYNRYMHPEPGFQSGPGDFVDAN